MNDFWEVKKRWLLLTSLTSLFGVILCSFDFIRKKVYQLLETFQPQLLMVSGFLSSWSGKVEPSGLNKGPASGLHVERGSLEWSRGRLPWVDSWWGKRPPRATVFFSPLLSICPWKGLPTAAAVLFLDRSPHGLASRDVAQNRGYRHFRIQELEKVGQNLYLLPLTRLCVDLFLPPPVGPSLLLHAERIRSYFTVPFLQRIVDYLIWLKNNHLVGVDRFSG